jgi:stage V sporulation protein SpoVS
MQAKELKREALYRLPALLAALLGISVTEVRPLPTEKKGLDAALEAGGRVWFVEVTSSSSPRTVAAAAEQLHRHVAAAQLSALGVLVVPYMTKAGARTATGLELNWIDLAGNGHIRDQGLHVRVEGLPNLLPARGRPSTPFAPTSARVSRLMLLDPWRWWRQKSLASETGLDDGHVSRVVRRLDDDLLLDRQGPEFRPRDPYALLDAWADDYRFDRHDVVSGHITGSGMEVADSLHRQLVDSNIDHAFTGLPAAWALGQHARFRLVSVYVAGDPRVAAGALGLRRGERGANVQVIGPDDEGVFAGARDVHGRTCVSPPQVYLDLLHLPERAKEAAEQLRSDKLLWETHA